MGIADSARRSLPSDRQSRKAQAVIHFDLDGLGYHNGNRDDHSASKEAEDQTDTIIVNQSQP